MASLGLIALGFLALILFTSNPFARLLPAVPEGNDLNPLLQDPGTILHPPVICRLHRFGGTIRFAVAVLLEGTDRASLATLEPTWTNIAWALLTLGICPGQLVGRITNSAGAAGGSGTGTGGKRQLRLGSSVSH